MKRLLLVLALLLATPAHATVTTGTRTVSYSPTASTSVFAVPYPFLEKSHLAVTRLNETTNATTTLTLNSDYSVKIPTAGNLDGEVTLSVAIGSNFTLTITRTVPVTQEVAFSSQGTYNAQRVEDAFDKLTMILQQLQAVAGSGESVETHEGQSDAHTQYALLPGRSGGQTLYGGTDISDNLTLGSTSDASKGFIYLGTSSAFDENQSRLGIGTATPTVALDIVGSAEITGDVEVGSGMAVGFSGSPGDDGLQIGDADFELRWDSAASEAYLEWEGTASRFLYSRSGNTLDFNLNSTDVWNASDARLNVEVPLTVNVTTPTAGIELEVNGEAAIDTELIIEGFSDTAQSESSVAIHKETSVGLLNISGANTIGGVETSTEAFINLYGSGYADATKQGTILINTDTAGDGFVVEGGDFKVTNGAFYANRPVKSIGSSTTLTFADCNSVIVSTQSAAASTVAVTLPTDGTTTPTDGCMITLIASDTDPHWTVSPASGDAIVGPCLIDTATAADIVDYFPGTTSRAIELDDTTSNVGDFWTAVYDGEDTWYTIGCVGFDDIP